VRVRVRTCRARNPRPYVAHVIPASSVPPLSFSRGFTSAGDYHSRTMRGETRIYADDSHRTRASEVAAASSRVSAFCRFADVVSSLPVLQALPLIILNVCNFRQQFSADTLSSPQSLVSRNLLEISRFQAEDSICRHVVAWSNNRVACKTLARLCSRFRDGCSFSLTSSRVFVTNKPTVLAARSERTGRWNQDYDKAADINLKFKESLSFSPAAVSFSKRRFDVNHRDMRVRPKFPANLQIKRPGRT